MNHGQNCPHLYESDGTTLRDPFKPCQAITTEGMDTVKCTNCGEIVSVHYDTDDCPKCKRTGCLMDDVIEGCEACALSDCATCARVIRRCGIVGDGCEFCTPNNID